VILDAGFLISLDRSEEAARQFLAAADRQGVELRTTHPVVGQVWRNGGRQARLASFLKGLELFSLDDGRLIGRLLAASGTSDVVDAHLIAVALRTGDAVLTGDVGDLGRLAAPLGPTAPVIHPWP
jgi:predicted nucleic acid-binding protein